MNQSAKLFIPSEPKDERDIAWRFRIVNAENIYSGKALSEYYKAAQKGRLSREAKASLVRHARSDSIVLDELEATILFIAKSLIRAESLTDSQVLFFDGAMRSFLNTASMKSRLEGIAVARRNLETYGKSLLKTDVRKIRAKVAFRELVAMLAPYEMIPTLVEFSPKYLASPITSRLIQASRAALRGSDGKKKQGAKIFLGQIARAIHGDNRKRTREYPYWELSFRYLNLTTYIKELRLGKVFDKGDTAAFYDAFKIPKEYRTAVLDRKRAPGQLALDIMTDSGQIHDPKTFKDFQPFVSKIQKKHFGGQVLTIARDLDPVLFGLLDLPTRHPALFALSDSLSVLEEVKL